MQHLAPTLVTPRLILRPLDPDAVGDRDFIVALLNQDSFIRHIADRGVRTREDAARFMRDGPVASYRRHGLGLLVMQRRADALPVGLCGLLQRDHFEHPDIGYALLDAHNGQGYAREAVLATLDWAWHVRAFPRVLATTTLDNVASIRLLESLGFRFEGLRLIPGYAAESRYFVLDAPSPRA
jgi:ribosomal-protein-alanine N-acetyltransferase